MPFDGKPQDYETKPDVFSLEGLIAWLETQDLAREYDYCSPFDCLLCRYFRANSVDVQSITIIGISLRGGESVEYPSILATAAGNEIEEESISTYGAALERARALLGDR